MRWQKSSTQVALGARKQIQTAVCLCRTPQRAPAARCCRRLFSSFVGFLDRPHARRVSACLSPALVAVGTMELTNVSNIAWALFLRSRVPTTAMTARRTRSGAPAPRGGRSAVPQLFRSFSTAVPQFFRTAPAAFPKLFRIALAAFPHSAQLTQLLRTAPAAFPKPSRTTCFSRPRPPRPWSVVGLGFRW